MDFGVIAYALACRCGTVMVIQTVILMFGLLTKSLDEELCASSIC